MKSEDGVQRQDTCEKTKAKIKNVYESTVEVEHQLLQWHRYSEARDLRWIKCCCCLKSTIICYNGWFLSVHQHAIPCGTAPRATGLAKVMKAAWSSFSAILFVRSQLSVIRLSSWGQFTIQTFYVKEGKT